MFERTDWLYFKVEYSPFYEVIRLENNFSVDLFVLSLPHPPKRKIINQFLVPTGTGKIIEGIAANTDFKSMGFRLAEQLPDTIVDKYNH